MSRFRSLARRMLGVRRIPTYYLPWITRPGLECALLVNNIEVRFKSGYNEGPFPASIVQYDADGRRVRDYAITLGDNADTAEVRLDPTAAGCGFVTVAGERIRSDLYVTLSDGATYTATHGRGEFIEHYPPWTAAMIALLGSALALAGRSLATFARDQFVYLGPDSRSHLVLMNLSNIVNRIRVEASDGGRTLGARLVRLPPRGTCLVDVGQLGGAPSGGTVVRRLRLEGNAWFNLYLLGAGPRDLAGPLSLMHVK